MHTEYIRSDTRDMDILAPEAQAYLLIADQQQAVDAVLAAHRSIAQAYTAAASHVQQGGRLIYVGAGSSGRLAAMDAAELFPTFSWDVHRAIALLAGGLRASRVEQEAAEDDSAAGYQDIQDIQPTAQDILIGVAASGKTPYVLGALQAAQEHQMLSIGIANNSPSALLSGVQYPVFLDTGAESIAGSTRLKAGTAQKIALNTFSSGMMLQLGRVYQNLMIDMQVSNQKLQQRAVAMVVACTQSSHEQALIALQACQFRSKIAVVMLHHQLSATEAENHLAQHHQHLRLALANPSSNQ